MFTKTQVQLIEDISTICVFFCIDYLLILNLIFYAEKFKPCPDGWEFYHHSEKCYKVVKKSKKKMADAEAHCQTVSGYRVRRLT